MIIYPARRRNDPIPEKHIKATMNKPRTLASRTTRKATGLLVATGKEGGVKVDFEAVTSQEDVTELIKEHGADLSFPEKLMLLMMYVEMVCAQGGKHSEVNSLAWTNNGKAFIIRNQDELVNRLLPVVFQKGKFSSFTRKLYRWGFRQILSKTKKGVQTDASIKTFYHKYFQRDNKPLLAKMRSVTAEAMKQMVKSDVSQEATSISPHSRQWDFSSAGINPLSGGLFHAQRPRPEASLSSLLATPSIHEAFRRARSPPELGFAGLISPSFLPNYAGPYNLAASSSLSNTGMQSPLVAVNQPLMPPLWPFSVESNFPSLLQNTAAMQLQQQHATDVTRAQQYLMAIADQHNFAATLLTQNLNSTDVEDNQLALRRQNDRSANLPWAGRMP